MEAVTPALAGATARDLRRGNGNPALPDRLSATIAALALAWQIPNELSGKVGSFIDN